MSVSTPITTAPPAGWARAPLDATAVRASAAAATPKADERSRRRAVEIAAAQRDRDRVDRRQIAVEIIFEPAAEAAGIAGRRDGAVGVVLREMARQPVFVFLEHKRAQRSAVGDQADRADRR